MRPELTLVAVRRLDRARELAADSRLKFRDVIFAKVLKNRQGALGDEIAIRLNGTDLTLQEDPDLRPSLRGDEADLRNVIPPGRQR